jgi:hypothetical protein
MFKHNKKRNTGLIYEFLNRWIAISILENKDSNIIISKEILEKHFDKNSELAKELILFKTINESKELGRESAKDLIEKVKKINNKIIESRLELEKTALIHDINKNFGKDIFFNQQIENYKNFATIQILLNSWRKKDLFENNIAEIHILEENLIEQLQNVKNETNDGIINMKTEEIDYLVLDLLTEKINNKFTNILNEKQKKILNCYVLDNKISLKEIFQETRDYIEKFYENKTFPKEIKEKIEDVLEMLYEYTDFEKINNEMIEVYLGAAFLEKELITSRPALQQYMK